VKDSCPSCDSTEGIREILYGLPEYPVDESKYFVGGCLITINDPNWACIECGWRGLSINNDHGTELHE